jgi:NAD(P)-dependent dehydrogenase (short-subunit alcohol dehydrogenase family)
MQYNLIGKKALITGSSRGIGSAIASDLARNGADIIVHYVGNKNHAEEMKEKIEALGRSCRILQADLCKPNSVEGLIEGIGGVDILVLNASVQFRNQWEKISSEEFYSQINCNLLSSMLLIQQAVPFMRQNKWGRIVTIGSVQETKPHPDMLVYSASKAAQTNMAKSLAGQLAKDGITVNNIAPGVISTDRNREALADKEYAKKVMNSIPAGFFGEPADCAGIVSLLCSDAGRYITGQSIYVDGGKCL